MNSVDFTAEQAISGQTPAAVLAQIAAERPDLRPYLAMNPAAYPELLSWLSRLGDPAVDAALAQRARLVHAVAAVPALPAQSGQGRTAPHTWQSVGHLPVPPGGQPSAISVGMPQAAGQPGVHALGGTQTKRKHRGRSVGWVLAVVLAVVAGFLFWPRPGQSPYLRPYATKPNEAWTFDVSRLPGYSPANSANPNPRHFGSVVKAGAVWVATVSYSGRFVVLGLDPPTGEIRWEAPFEVFPACRGSGPGPNATVLCVTAADKSEKQGLTALDADTGEKLSYTTLGLGMQGFTMLGVDALLYGFDEGFGRKVARFAPDGSELWAVDVTPGGGGTWSEALGGPQLYPLDDSVVVESPLSQERQTRRNLWLLDHQGSVLWQGQGEFKGVDPDGRILVQTLERDLTPVGVVLLDQQGRVLWELVGYRLLAPLSTDNSIRLLAFNRSDELVELDPTNGSETRLLLEAQDDEAVGSARVVAVGKRLMVDVGGELVAVDLASGDAIWTADFDESVHRVMTDGERLVFMTSGALVAISIKDGTESWRLAVPERAGYVTLDKEIVLVDDAGGRLSLLRS